MRENRDFVVPVNILTPFACAPFSWAAQHTTVCLDIPLQYTHQKVAKAGKVHTITFIQTHLNFDHGFIKHGQWYHKTFLTCYTVV